MAPSKRPQETAVAEEESSPKKLNTNFTKEDIEHFFNAQIWKSEFQDEIQKQVKESSPYKWGTIKHLMDDTLLRQVRKEVLSEIAFTKKETDIYKVYQLGDLANLSGLIGMTCPGYLHCINYELRYTPKSLGMLFLESQGAVS